MKRFLLLLLVFLSPLAVKAQVPNQLVTLSSNGKYLVNSITGQPVFLTGEDGFLASLQLSNADVTTYLNDRASRGFNAIWLGVTDQLDQNNAPRDFSGNVPFDAAWFTNPDAAYWAHQDFVIQQAAALGITIFLQPSFVGNADGNVYDTPAYLASSAATVTAYGTFIGNRYKGFNNIVYVVGGDYNSAQTAVATKVADLASAIAAADPNHIITLEPCRVGTCSPANQDSVVSYGGVGSVPSYIRLNWAYDTQANVVAGCQAAFTNSSGGSFPPLMGEDWYELEHSITGFQVRQEGYWAILSGCYAGRLFGNGPIWSFNSTPSGNTSPSWQSQLSSAGSVSQQFMGQLMRSREHWLMVPDKTHAVLTAGFGSGSTLSVAARSSDGQTVIAYLSDGNATTKTINMSSIVSSSSTAIAWWYAPLTGAATLIGTFPNSGSQTFTAPSGSDWVLVIDDDAANLGAPGGGAGNNPVPSITSLNPSSATAGGPAFTLTVNGSGFISSSVVNFNGSARTTTFVSATQIKASILASDIATSGTANVTVTNPAPGGGTTPNFAFTISSSSNPVPTLASISPTSGLLGQSVALTLTGTNFISSSVVNFGSNPNTGGVVSNGGNTLTITIPAAQLNAAGTVSVTVTNPAPGGGTTGAQTFTVNNPVPSITTISPISATLNGLGFTLTVNGSNFVNGSVVNFNGTAKSTTFVSATQVTASILATDLLTIGNFPVTVSNPAPGGGTSGSVTFAITNPPPVLASLSPTSATTGGPAFTLTLTGTGFVSGATVNFGANPAITPSSVTSTQIMATVPAADIAAAGSVNVTVTNPAPGGGTSNAQAFAITNPVPAETSLSPASATAGGAGFTLTVNGSGFVSTSVVKFNGASKTTTFVSATQITAAITAADIATAGTASVTVSNPAPGGGTSGSQSFAINNPAPTATSMSPTTATAGGAGFTLMVNGTGFVSTSVVKFNGASKTTTFVSATQITAAITAADIATAGTVNVAVTNPAPGGGTSGNLPFTINNPSNLTITSLSPASVTAGGVGFTLTVNGTGFASGATVQFNSANRTTTFVSGTQVTAAITAADIETAGTVNVTVTNPAPGGGVSNAQTFTINNPVPTEISIVPPSATAGGVAFTLTVNGTGFVSGSVVKFNGAAKTTTLVSATQVTAAIAAADIATAGIVNVVVTNPAPGGGTSGNIQFTINNPNVTVTSLSPPSTNAGGAAFTLTINGSGFASGATVNFGNNPAITPSSVTNTQIIATIPAADIATGGTANVTVTNPPPGGGISSAQTFTINNPAPVASSLSPTNATAGGAGFTLTVNGTGFVSGSEVNFNGAAKTTTFVSATRITAVIAAADIATAGAVNVAIANPAPGGGTSANLPFTINNPSNLTITSLSPASATAGGAGFTLTVNGTGFASGATVQFNGANRTTTFVSGTQVTAAITAADIATAGTVNITVTNPAPGGGISNAQTFTMNNPVPTEISIVPPGATAGGVAFTLTVNGTGFVPGSAVKFNGAAKTTTLVSATQVTAAIAAADIATAGLVNVAVTTPAPGGGTSGNIQFTINNPNVTVTSLSPASTAAGSAAFTLTINGSGFASGATVNFGNNPAIIPSSVTNTQIIATIPAADIATGGTANVTVTNPPPGGGISSAQTFTINNPAPVASSLSPTNATAGGTGFTLTVNGTGFVSGSVVSFNGASKATTFVSATKITAVIAAADIATAGAVNIAVTNPAPGGGTSANLPFTINNPSNLTITSLSPASATAGGAGFTLTVNGTGFVNGAAVQFNGANRTTTFVSGTQVTATITAADIATAATVNVTVTNPAPGGGTSNAQAFTINNPSSLTITSLSPSSATAGGAGFTLTVNGTGFVSGSVVNVGGSAKATTFKSATQLTAAISASDIAAGGVLNVIVTNPAPGGGTSNSATFTVNNAVPTLSSLSPSSVFAGSGAFTLTVNGAGFVNGASVQFNGANRTTTFVSSTQVTAAILASDVTTAGTANVTVRNPAPTTGPSASQALNITNENNPVPAISGLGTNHVTGGAAFTLTVNGSNFEAKSVVNLNGKAEPTTFVSATKISAAIPASDVAVAGSANVTVTNPAPGGGTSPASTFFVDGYTLGGSSTASIATGQPATLQITVTPTANGFANPVAFTVSGLPSGVSALFNPVSVTPGAKPAATMLTISDGFTPASRAKSQADISGGGIAPPLFLFCAIALLAWLGFETRGRSIPEMRRYATVGLLVFMLFAGSVLGGCALGVTSSPSNQTSQLTVTATSGTMTQTFGVTLTVTH